MVRTGDKLERRVSASYCGTSRRQLRLYKYLLLLFYLKGGEGLTATPSTRLHVSAAFIYLGIEIPLLFCTFNLSEARNQTRSYFVVTRLVVKLHVHPAPIRGPQVDRAHAADGQRLQNGDVAAAAAYAAPPPPLVILPEQVQGLPGCQNRQWLPHVF